MLQGEYSSFSEAAATFTKAVSQRRSAKKMFLVISQDSQENTCEFCETSQNTLLNSKNRILENNHVLAITMFTRILKKGLGV